MNYQQLLDLIEDEIIDVDKTFFDHIELLMERAHLRIQHDLDLNANRIEEVMSAAGAEVFVPTDLILVRGIRLKDGDYLLEKDTSFLRSYWPNPLLIGTPKYYAWKDDQTILLAPTPASADIEVSYTVRLPVLSTIQTTNWLSEYAPDLLQVALMLEAAAWTKDMELVALYNERYASTLNGIALEYNLRKRTDEYRKGEPVARVGQ